MKVIMRGGPEEFDGRELDLIGMRYNFPLKYRHGSYVGTRYCDECKCEHAFFKDIFNAVYEVTSRGFADFKCIE